jgi:hypothetical protein
MNNYDIEMFINLRNHENCQNLDQNIIDTIIANSSNNEKNKKYKNQKKVVNILKNPNIKIIKDKMVNKINLILNKISENNIENLIIEFIENIKINNIDEYNEFLKIFYNKILLEINFIKFYIKFLEIISQVYLVVYNYTLEYFFNLIESKFYSDYYSKNYENFINDSDDINKRINNLTLISDLLKLNYFKENFLNYFEDLLLNQTKHLGDIHHWFKNNNISEDNKVKIQNLINKNNQLREKILLENLIDKNNVISENKQQKIIYKKINNNNIELENMLEEYLFIDNFESLEDYINTNCHDAIGKNKFCEFIFSKFFKMDNQESNKILNLLKSLVKKKILFKSNLSRGLLNIYNKGTSSKIKTILLFLKNMGITNGLENLMMKYNLEINI